MGGKNQEPKGIKEFNGKVEDQGGLRLRHLQRVEMPPLEGQVELEQIKYFSWSWKEAVTSLSFLTLGGMIPRAGVRPLMEIFKASLDGGSEQPDPVKDVPAHCRRVGFDGL